MEQMIAQQLALEHPDVVGHLILLGTGLLGEEGMTLIELSPEEQADPVASLTHSSHHPKPARRPVAII